jgi:large subunit ribosomal protein L25
MELAHLKVEYRSGTGKGVARRLRSIGRIPAILYGENIENMSLSVNTKELKTILEKGAGTHTVLDLEIDADNKKVSEKAVIKEIQRDPLKGSYTHIDFLKIDLSKKIETSVPLIMIGESPGVKEGGVLQHGLREIEIECLVKDIPKHIEIDVSSLNIGDTIRVSDISRLDGVKFLTQDEETVISIIHQMEFKEAEVIAEAVEPEVIGEKEKETEKPSGSS